MIANVVNAYAEALHASIAALVADAGVVAMTKDILRDRYSFVAKRRAIAFAQDFGYEDLLERATVGPIMSRGKDLAKNWTRRKLRRERVKANARRRETRGPRTRLGWIAPRVMVTAEDRVSGGIHNIAVRFNHEFRDGLAKACTCPKLYAVSRPLYSFTSNAEVAESFMRVHRCDVHGEVST